MENLPPQEPKDSSENPALLGDILPETMEEIRRRSEAPDLEKARRTLVNLLRDAHANPADVESARLTIMELEQEAKDD